MRKKVTAAGILLIFLLVGTGISGVYSWFTDHGQRTNSFSVGMNEVEIKEEFPNAELTPGGNIKKEVQFTNTGQVPMYVRACFLFSSKEAQEGSEVLMGSTLWENGQDGYYYYRDVVNPGENTELFLKGISWKGEEETENFTLTVYTETIQATGHTEAKEAFAGMMKRKKGEEA